MSQPEAERGREGWIRGLRAELEKRRAEGVYRELRTVESGQGPVIRVEGKEYLQFCTNNYLGLVTEPEVVEAARATTAQYGTGAGASRLVAGSMEMHRELEAALAGWKHAEAALVFPSGYMANLAVLTTFAGAGDLVVSDKWNHASLLDGAKFSGALARTFPHRHYERAEELLNSPRRHGGTEEDENGKKFLVTDSVFSMDGDVADLRAAAEAARRTDSMLIVDEAHATGVLGATGAGAAELQGVEDQVDVTVGTLSKALASVGGFVTGKREVIETLVNAGRGFIYTTALPPGCCAAALAAVRLVRRDPGRRERVMHLARWVKRELVARGFDCGEAGEAESPIVPVVLGESRRAVKWAEALRERGMWVPAIRPPTVAVGKARLRVSVMATHTEEQVGRLVEEMGKLKALAEF